MILQNNRTMVVGAGLAGAEAAWQLARRGFPVDLHEMRPLASTPAHRTDGMAELVCSNSFRSDDEASAIGMLHREMRAAGSLVMEAADATRVPAGGALAVDRGAFSAYITARLTSHPLVRVLRGEVAEIPTDGRPVIVATGPLTAGAIADSIRRLTGADYLHFFDALAPIVEADTVDRSVAWEQSRWDKGDSADYLNCPLDRSQYYGFVDALLAGRTVDFRQWEIDDPSFARYFEGCLPIEVMACRGRDTLAFGPMKPSGLREPRTGARPFAVVQLRKENRAGTLMNIVGFQTKLAHGEQARIFRMIPGLERAEFARLGGLHRNSFIPSPVLLDRRLRLKTCPSVAFAGQITGCEGYVESAAIGYLAGANPSEPPPPTTAMGALLGHVLGDNMIDIKDFQPMNITFGLFPPLSGTIKKAERKAQVLARAAKEFDQWIAAQPPPLSPR
ncbi:methylenetetrahydrofolate--tRNA-(uracil-5-)-methyltransferase TrmFO [Alphaproteobacteria bacterium]|nr:methylenetetrahydrofolate--tRNA-(uracil-5-)-methyltransferase TrmFO [Alphaproteobacteria bacterium]